MHANRIIKWGIVLCLLATLPGLTAALAQGQEPAAKQLPVVTEPGESTVFVPWQNNETEPNNAPQNADQVVEGWQSWGTFNEVVGGTIGYGGDVDYWVLRAEDEDPDLCFTCDYDHSHYPVLIDIEAQSLGSPVDSVICLYAPDGTELVCNDDTDTLDSMLYYNFSEGVNYYLSVRNYNSLGGSTYRYQVYASIPLLISAAAANLGTGYVDGIPFKAGDILAYSDFRGAGIVYPKWVMFFDLSDLEVTGNLTNLASGWSNSDYLLVGFAKQVSLPGITGQVKPWDIAIFNPTTIGPKTAGTFSRWWTGANYALTTSGEKIDAIEWPSWLGYDSLFISTTGAARVYGSPGTTIKLADEDVGFWRDGSVFPSVWSRTFDGSVEPEINLAKEDVIGLSSNFYEYWQNDEDVNITQWYLVLQGFTPFDEGTITQKDIIHVSENNVWVVWHGPDFGWNYNIDAIQYQVWVFHGLYLP
jgi:hypothetical protein